jgi:hypothetical protein
MAGKWKLIATAAIACASLMLNVWLGTLLYRAFADLQLARIFPLGPPEHAQEEPAADLRPTLVIYGDSRALQWDTAPLTNRVRVVNLAQGGQTSAQLLLQLKGRPPVLSDWALVQIGINDLHPLGALRPRQQLIVDQLAGDLRAIVMQLRPRSTCIVVTTILPPGHVPLSRRLAWSPDTMELLARNNALIATLADGEHVWALDGDRLLRDGTGFLDRRYRSAEFFLHVNRAAYDVLNRELLRILVNSDHGVAAAETEAPEDGLLTRAASRCRLPARG